MIKNNSILPYFRKDTSSTLLALSAIALLLLTSSPMLLFKLVLQPVQATNIAPTSVRTDSPVNLEMLCSSAADAALTFNATGTPSSSEPRTTDLTGGTFQITNSSSNGGQILWSGSLYGGSITTDPKVTWYVDIYYNGDGQGSICGYSGFLEIQTSCPGGEDTSIALNKADYDPIGTGTIYGTVDCDTGGDTTTAQPSSSSSSSSTTGTATAQDRDSNSRDGDSDSDGIPDSSDNCDHNSHHRCFKEGDASTTATTTQQQPSSSTTGTAHDSDGDGIPDSSDKCLHNSYHRCFKEDTTTQQQSSSNRTGNQTR
jgi:hypothetical protein